MLLICCLLILTAGLTIAETTGKISGKVTDSKTNERLRYVNIVILESLLGAASHENGYYIIN
ncbi:MAG: carboxypeptidase-like regulatory domain-containing protein, partial [Ignavibacteria bacterium]